MTKKNLREIIEIWNILEKFFEAGLRNNSRDLRVLRNFCSRNDEIG